jgi:hypothetical protein
VEKALETCRTLRLATATIMSQAVATGQRQSEAELQQKIKRGLATVPNIFKTGWYAPPPEGIAVLFGTPSDAYQRTRFNSLRTRAYWPTSRHMMDNESVGILYASPIATSGIIGDWGGTYYRGTNEKIRQHLKVCLETVEQLADFAQVGMKFSDISHHADTLLKERGLTTDRTLILSRPDATGTNCGHTIPWTDIPPTPEQAAIIKSRDQRAVNTLISDQRLFIDASQQAVIPESIAYTTELRLESLSDPLLPNTFFHLITCFDRGKKRLLVIITLSLQKWA